MVQRVNMGKNDTKSFTVQKGSGEYDEGGNL